MKNSLLYFMLLMLLSCNAKKDEPTEQERLLQEQLLGEWVPLGEKSEDYIPKGYTFYADEVVESKQGFYKRATIEGDTLNRGWRVHYLGSTSKYTVSGKTIRIYNPADSLWESLIIGRLINDTLSVKSKDKVYWYKKISYDLETAPTFDAIVLTTLGCFGKCPVTSTMITSDGKVAFIGESFATKEGIYVGSVPVNVFKEFQNNYRKAALDSIVTNFDAGGEDSETVEVSFVKNGKIYKTIQDYGSVGPKELIWAHIPLRFLFQHMELSKVNVWHQTVPLEYEFFGFIKGDKVLRLQPSERFLLWNYLRQAQSVHKKPVNRFNMFFADNYFDITHNDEVGESLRSNKDRKLNSIVTDGQFYTFHVDGEKPYTVDIGFNFFDTNFSETEMKEKSEANMVNLPF